MAKFSKEQQAIANKIADTCERLGIDPALALSVGWTENEFKNRTSPKGAIGPMQVMPENAKGLGMEVDDLKDIDKNIEAGCRILKENIDRYGDTMLAVAAYNASPKTVDKAMKAGDISLLPKETQSYLKTIDQMYPLDQPGTVAVAEEAKTFTTDPELPEHIKDPSIPVSMEGLPDWYQTIRPMLGGEKGEIDVETARALTGGLGFLAGTAEKAGDYIGKISSDKTAATESLKKIAEQMEKTGAAGLRPESLVPTSEQQARGIQGTKKETGITGRASQTMYNERTAQIARQEKAQRELLQRLQRQGLIDPSKAYSLTEGISAATPSGVLISPQESMRLEQELGRKAGAAESQMRSARAAAEAPGVLSKTLGRIPLGSTLMGVSAGQNIAEAAKELEAGNVTGAGIRGAGGLGALMSLVPHPGMRLAGTAMDIASEPAAYIQKALRENKLRQQRGLAPVTRGAAEIEYDIQGNPVR